jgi:16S rRNA (cytosine967-C5)-methyltransferase
MTPASPNPRQRKPFSPGSSPGKRDGNPARKSSTEPVRSKETARSLAWQVLTEIEVGGAYANIALPRALDDCDLDERDRGFATELVYGTTRMRRACDFALDRFLMKPPDLDIRTVLRLGAYQLLFANVAPHAAVGETVGMMPAGLRPFVNAVLRKVSSTPVIWPDDATRLSYPDWLVDRLTAELGRDEALLTLERMNEAPPVSVRSDGYTQDRSSTAVADLVGAQSGERVLDLCAAPGGKATRMAASGAYVAAADRSFHRSKLVASNTRRLDAPVGTIVADGMHPPFAEASFDRVLLDAPCSGLGALRRRPDARWRITAKDIDELVVVQRDLLASARRMVKPGGTLVYSVCTVTAVESIDHDTFNWPALPPAEAPWQPFGRGARILPHNDDTDGMVVLRWTRPTSAN